MYNPFSNITVHCYIYDEAFKNEVLRLMNDDCFYRKEGDVLFSYDDGMMNIKDDIVHMELSAYGISSSLNYFEFWDGDFDPILNWNCGYTSTKQHQDYVKLLDYIPIEIPGFTKESVDYKPLQTLLKQAIASHKVELEIYPDELFYSDPEKPQEFFIAGKSLVYFEGCDGTGVIIPEGIAEICEDAFTIEQKRRTSFWGEHVRQLFRVETVCFPKSLVKIGDRAFYKCNLDGEIKLYSNLSSIGASAFEENSIESVVLEDGIKKIDKLAFANMPTLTHAIIPASVKKIGDKAFLGCQNLTIHTTKGSYAEAYAVENGIKVEWI